MRTDVAVVGGGVMGLATARSLARAGIDVALFERFTIGHDRGSSHAATRVFRTLYQDPLYVRMALASLPLWQELGSDLVRLTGGIHVDELATLERFCSAINVCGARAVLLSERERADRTPWLDADGPAMFVPDIGVIAAERTLRALRSSAEGSGAEIHEGIQVEAVEPRTDGVSLSTSSGAVDARVCVVAAGAWVAGLIDPIDIHLPVRTTREQVMYFSRPEESGPTMPFVHNVGYWVYGLPGLEPDAPMKLGEHGTGFEVTPDGRGFDIDDPPATRMREYVSRYLPDVDPDPVGYDTCLYTTTPDEDFVIDRVGPVVVVSPCSGHGFKFAPLIGELAASLATGRDPSVPLGRFSLSRFAL